MLSLLLATMTLAPPALACEEGKPCTSEHCTMRDAGEEAADKAEVEAAQAEETATTLKLTVAGMKCGACSKKVTTALEGVEGVTAAAVDHVNGTAEVVFETGATSADALVAVVADLGYEVAVSTD